MPEIHAQFCEAILGSIRHEILLGMASQSERRARDSPPGAEQSARYEFELKAPDCDLVLEVASDQCTTHKAPSVRDDEESKLER